MEETFQQSITDLEQFHKFTEEEMKILENADRAAEEMAMPEYEHYLKHELSTESVEIAGKYGLFGIPIKKEYGGQDASPLTLALVQERLSQNGLGFSTLYDVQIFICGLAIQRWGREEQKKEYLKEIAKGNKIFAFGLTEPDAGSDPSSMRTNYTKKGSKFIINGTKYLISNGSIADFIILFATSAEEKNNITAFIVDTKSEGFEVAMHLKEKIGLFTSDTDMLQFNNIEVPEENILGSLGKGLHVGYSSLINGRLGIGSASLGLIDGALNAVINRSRERVQFGKPIGKHQLIQQHLSAIRQNLEMARWPVYTSALKKEIYDKNPDNKELIAEMDLHSSLAKRISSRLAFESADRAVQVFGGFGYSLLSPVGQLFCDSRVTRIYEGTDEIQDLKIASSLLGKDFEAYK